MRLDERMVAEGLAADRKQAAALIMAARVLVDDEPCDKPGTVVKPGSQIRLRGVKVAVARSGAKLAAALESFGTVVKDRVCLDIGCSTGGFTEVLLAASAARVIALDVAYGFLHPKLRTDSRVIVRERTHILKTKPEDFDPVPEFFCMDISFLHPMAVLKHLRKLCIAWKKDLPGIVLFKPQFAAEKKMLRKGIVIPGFLEELRKHFETEARENGISIHRSMESPVHGASGNTEFLYELTVSSASELQL